MEQIPFNDVFIHGLVRDAQGRKMSKSLGNGIDPLEIIDKYGADALRFALATGNSPGNDMRFSDEKLESARNFNNKIWNAARFVLMNLDIDSIVLPEEKTLALEDRWIISRYNTLVGEVTDNISNYEIGIALAKLYDFFWDVFCDWYIELAKPRLSQGDKTAQNVIAYVLSNSLRLLHPFLPFITEEIWQSLPRQADESESLSESLMVCSWPSVKDKFSYAEDEGRMESVIEAIRAIRNRRAEMNVPPSRKAKLIIITARPDIYSEETEKHFIKLASASELEFLPEYHDDTAVQIITDTATIYIPLADIIDLEKEKARLEKEKAISETEIERLVKKLSNEGFTAKAPAAVIDAERTKLAKQRDVLAGIVTALEKLNR